MNWCENVEEQLKISYDKVEILLSRLAGDQTNAILQDMLSSHSISVTTDEALGIAMSVQVVMENLRNGIAKQEKILDGTLVGVGSFWDGTRVGEAPNEFDYLYALRGVSKYITGCYKCGIGKYRLKCKDGNELAGASNALSNFAVRDRLYVCITRSMNKNSLPKNLHHGGVLSPFFSGVRKNGPAITLLFVWTGDRYKSKPLLISVDVTIAIRPVHLQAFMQDEATLLAEYQFQNGGRILPESYLIADANLDTVWQRTTANLEVPIVSNMRPLLSNTIRMLKILNHAVLTIRESDGKSHTNRQLYQLGNDARYSTDMDAYSASAGDHYNLVSIGTERTNMNLTSNKIDEAISSLVAARNLHLTEVNPDGNGGMAPDDKTIAMSVLASKLCQLLLDDTEVVSEESSFILKQDISVHWQQRGYLEPSKLSYLPDLLDPYQCNFLFEDCKPLITLKSCVLKYAVMELMHFCEAPQQSTRNDDVGFDMDLVVRVLKKIHRSMQLQHPLLGHPILTYNVSPRVQHCAGQNRRLTQDAENRLSDILYDLLGLLIETLDSK